MTNTEQWLKRDEAVIASTLSRVFDVVAESGEGSWITDADGKRYLDLACGIAVTSIGHCHPKVVEAIERQARTLIHTSVVTHNEPMVALAERITKAAPYMESGKVFFSNTGAEVVDGGLKLARKVTHRPGVIAFRRAFHGRTLAATSLTTANGKYRAGYEPLLSSVHIASYCGEKGNVAAALAELDEILLVQAPDPAIGAMIVEPVMGEGGYVVAHREWLQGLRERCDEHGILLIFDEVQTGIARTGAMFAAEVFGITPDVILFAKGIANGMPLAGILASARVMDQWPVGAHGSTFGGNPVSCAAALATLDVIESEGLAARAKTAGAQIVQQISGLGAVDVVDVRGLGFMIGIELRSGEAAARVQKQCIENGVLILLCGVDSNIIRLIPPLNISDEDLAHGLEVLTAALKFA